MFICDTVPAASREVTPEGFLRLSARIGRAGLHSYRAAELGLPTGFSPDATLRVWRPPSEVFDPASMASFAGRPVTDDHPPAMVDAGNWRRFAVGHSGEAPTRDGDDHLVANLVINDAAAVARALDGAELSNGYHADFVFEPGETPEGERYDAVQRAIRGNHIALVEAGRCGTTCRVGDAAPVRDCGCGGAPPAADEADRIDRLVEERLLAVEGARRLIGPAFDGRRQGTAAIRRLAVGQAIGAARIEGRDEAYVAAAFDALVAAAQTGQGTLARHLAAGPAGLLDRRGALAARNHHLAQAWKGDQPEGTR